MKNQDDIIKGLLSFIDLWKSLAQKDHTGLYISFQHDLMIFWKDVKDTLKMPCAPRISSLVNGFWPSTRIQSSNNVTLSTDGL
jgi:hypothetical protein